GHTVAFDGGAGHVGLERLRRGPGDFDVVVTDLRMPIADGFDVLAGASNLPGAPPVILTSAYWTAEEVVLARDLGAFALLPKPFDLSKLAAAIEAASAKCQVPSA